MYSLLVAFVSSVRLILELDTAEGLWNLLIVMTVELN